LEEGEIPEFVLEAARLGGGPGGPGEAAVGGDEEEEEDDERGRRRRTRTATSYSEACPCLLRVLLWQATLTILPFQSYFCISKSFSSKALSHGKHKGSAQL